LEGIVKNAVESSELRKDESKGKTVTLKPFFTLLVHLTLSNIKTFLYIISSPSQTYRQNLFYIM
jgi:hypothetical protein